MRLQTKPGAWSTLPDGQRKRTCRAELDGLMAQAQALSDRRAESVALAMTEYFGVPPENMIVQGYGESELRVLSTVGSSLGLALENARLFERTRQRHARLDQPKKETGDHRPENQQRDQELVLEFAEFLSLGKVDAAEEQAGQEKH